MLVVGIPITILLLTQPTIFHLRASESNTPKNVVVANISGGGATVSWTTSQPTQASLNYGLTEDDLSLVEADLNSTLNHQIALTNLLSERNYYFVIKVNGVTYKNNNGRAFTFTTKQKEGAAVTPTPTPSVNLTSEVSASPTAALSPTPPTSTASAAANITEAEMESALGTKNPRYDLNHDGVVNSFDLIIWRNQHR